MPYAATTVGGGRHDSDLAFSDATAMFPDKRPTSSSPATAPGRAVSPLAASVRKKAYSNVQGKGRSRKRGKGRRRAR